MYLVGLLAGCVYLSDCSLPDRFNITESSIQNAPNRLPCPCSIKQTPLQSWRKHLWCAWLVCWPACCVSLSISLSLSRVPAASQIRKQIECKCNNTDSNEVGKSQLGSLFGWFVWWLCLNVKVYVCIVRSLFLYISLPLCSPSCSQTQWHIINNTESMSMIALCISSHADAVTQTQIQSSAQIWWCVWMVCWPVGCAEPKRQIK